MGVKANGLEVIDLGQMAYAAAYAEQCRVVDDAGIAPLVFDETAEAVERGSGIEQRPRRAAGRRDVRREPEFRHPERDHPRSQVDGEFDEVGGAFALERRDRLGDLEPVSDGAAERLVHAREERLAPRAAPRRELRHELQRG